jgi:hypothetical protein
MHSVYGDTVLDPFLGTGTTLAGAVAACRNSIGIEIDKGLSGAIQRTVNDSLTVGLNRIRTRLSDHRDFVYSQIELGREVKHRNRTYGFPVITSQETDIVFYLPCGLNAHPSGAFEVEYELADADAAGPSAQWEPFEAATPAK